MAEVSEDRGGKNKQQQKRKTGKIGLIYYNQNN